MPLHFTCPHCGQETLVDDHYAGLSGPCATCGKEITVPYFASAGPAQIVAAATKPSNVSPAIDAIPTHPKSNRIGVVVMLIVSGIFAFVAVAGLLMVVFFPLLSRARGVAHRERSAKNIRQIATAMNAYADKYGSYPPAYVADDQGRPMHSWRVLILPFLGQQDLYNRYDFTQPWDGPQNLTLLPEMPEVFASPADTQAVVLSETSYMVVRGPTTAFPGTRSTKPQELTDGLTSTALIVEVAGTGVGWLEPVDLEYDKMLFEVNSAPGSDIGSAFLDGAHIATADGVSHFLPNDTLPEYIQAMLSISKADFVPWDEIEQ